jgi:hypothetical protein
MVRYDKPNSENDLVRDAKLRMMPGTPSIMLEDPVVGEIRNGRKIVSVDKIKQNRIVNIFITKLRNINIDNKPLISTVTNELIIINPEITLDMLKKATNDNTLSNYDSFVKNYYSAMIDDMMDEVFGEKVTCINEVPYSMVSSQQKPNVVTYDFLN